MILTKSYANMKGGEDESESFTKKTSGRVFRVFDEGQDSKYGDKDTTT